MNFYPFFAPIILTDSLFALYGGDVTKGTSDQRKLAYRMAEMAATEDLSTFMLPTITTGTFYPPFISPIITEFTYVHRVILTRFIDDEEDIYWTISGTANVYVNLRNDARGIVDLNYLFANCNCHSAWRMQPAQVQMVYEAGLPSGTTYQPDIMIGLKAYADIMLNEIVGFGNEGAGDVGIERFQSQSYSEVRRIKNTTFGSSPMANFVQRKLQRVRKLRYVGL